jgi:hypothetical protein
MYSIAEIELKKPHKALFNLHSTPGLGAAARNVAAAAASPRRPPLIRWRHCRLVGGANPCEAEGRRRCRCSSTGQRQPRAAASHSPSPPKLAAERGRAGKRGRPASKCRASCAVCKMIRCKLGCPGRVNIEQDAASDAGVRRQGFQRVWA